MRAIAPTERVYTNNGGRAVVTPHGVRALRNAHPGDYVWVSCERCGAVPPAVYEPRTETPVRYSYGVAYPMPPREVGTLIVLSQDNRTVAAFCSGCGWPAPVRYVHDKHSGQRERARCNGRCLGASCGSGCDCRCRGRCHGNGVCQCM